MIKIYIDTKTNRVFTSEYPMKGDRYVNLGDCASLQAAQSICGGIIIGQLLSSRLGITVKNRLGEFLPQTIEDINDAFTCKN